MASIRDSVSFRAGGLDPDGFFRGRAGAREPFTVVFSGLGPVHFFATADAARDLFAVPGVMLEAPTPNPIEPIAGKDSVILVSGDDHRNKRRLPMPALHGQRMRSRAQVMARATRDETASWRPGERIALAAVARSIALRIIVLAMSGVENAEHYQEFVDVTTALMHANTAPLMLLPWLRKDFAVMGPWARLVRLRERFDALLTAQVEARRADTDHSVLDPGRFLDKSPTPFECLPFGGGFRRRPGASFAAYESAVSIGTLMNSVELRMPSRERRCNGPRSAQRGIAVVPRREVRLDVIRRW